MITDKQELYKRIFKIINDNGHNDIQISYKKNGKYFFEVLHEPAKEIQNVMMETIIAIGEKNTLVFSSTLNPSIDGSVNPITQIIDVIMFDLEAREIAPTNVIPSETQVIHDLYKSQLNWYIEQTKLNEERLDKRLKEIMKSQNISSEIDAQKIDFSGILPHIMPVLEVLKNLGSK